MAHHDHHLPNRPPVDRHGGLAMALFAARLVERPPSTQRTWGYRRAEVIAALAQAGVLLIGALILPRAIRLLRETVSVLPDHPVGYRAGFRIAASMRARTVRDRSSSGR